MQLLYIVHSDTEYEGLWTAALLIGGSNCLAKMRYYDSEGESNNMLCQSVRSALLTTQSQFADEFFQCTQVDNFVAVGFGGNKKNRQRSSRVAAAVCFELQAKKRVNEFIWHQGFQKLVRQVRSCFNFGAR